MKTLASRNVSSDHTCHHSVFSRRPPPSPPQDQRNVVGPSHHIVSYRTYFRTYLGEDQHIQLERRDRVAACRKAVEADTVEFDSIQPQHLGSARRL